MPFKVLMLVSLMFPLIMGNSEVSKRYHRNYHDNGQIKAEGWLGSQGKIGYWKYYNQNGKISEKGHYQTNKREAYWYFYGASGKLVKEGHYKDGKKVDWWLFYDRNGKINHKCQLDMGKKNGYCLKYTDEKLTSAVKYSNGKKIKEWFTFSSFKKENKLSDLR